MDILYIVLAFSVLWISAAIFWLIFQAASLIKNFNDVLAEVKDKVDSIENAISGIRHRFESATGSLGVVVGGIEKLVEYVVEKKRKKDIVRT